MRFCVIDDFLPTDLITKLYPVVEYREHLPYDNDADEISDISVYNPEGISCNSYPPELVYTVHRYFDYLVPYVEKFIGEWKAIEWWTNPNNVVPWHIDFELDSWMFPDNHSEEFLLSRLPAISTVYYPWVDIEKGGELLLLDDPSFLSKYMSKTESYKMNKELQTQIVPRTNRLVLFETGIFHKANMYEGNGRYSIGANFYNIDLTYKPKTTNKY